MIRKFKVMALISILLASTPVFSSAVKKVDQSDPVKMVYSLYDCDLNNCLVRLREDEDYYYSPSMHGLLKEMEQWQNKKASLA